MPRTISTKPAYSVRWWCEKGCVPPERDVFSILRTCAAYRYQSPVPPLKGRVIEGDARRASTLLRSYKDKVKLVITSPPYLDITDYHEDQWLRLWFLGGAAKPNAGREKTTAIGESSHTGNSFGGMEGCGAAPSGFGASCDSHCGTRLGEEQLRVGLLDSLNSTGRNFKLAEARQTVIKNGQRRSSERPRIPSHRSNTTFASRLPDESTRPPVLVQPARTSQLLDATTLRRSCFSRMVESEFMPEGFSRPVKKDDQGDDLDGPEFDAMEQPVRVKPVGSSTHTISFPAADDCRYPISLRATSNCDPNRWV